MLDYYFDRAGLTVRRERIGAVYLGKFPPVLNLTFSSGELWSSKMDYQFFVKFLSSLIMNLILAGVPYDGMPTAVIETVHISLTVIFAVLSTIGIVFTIVCLAFNFVFRDRK